MLVDVVIGTRPEIIKMASVVHTLIAKEIPYRLIHTGQHYDSNLSETFFDDLTLPRADAFLEVGSGSQSEQTANAMIKLEEDFQEHFPSIILVQGDTNTVLAGALAGHKLGIPVGHVEAGLRSYDRRMPEEYNRRIADHISTLLFAPTQGAVDILKREHVWGDIHLTGNTVIDAIERYAPVAEKWSSILDEIKADKYILVTAHRAENVDNPEILADLVRICTESPLPVVYPIHPRTISKLKEFGQYEELTSSQNVTLLPPVGYFDFIMLMRHSFLILSDSGGIQEEATSASIAKRVVIFRENTERPEAVDSGFAVVAGTDAEKVLSVLHSEVEEGAVVPDVESPFGDGKAGEKIVELVTQLKNL